MKKTAETNAMRALPSVDRLLGEPRLRKLIDTYSHEAVVDLIREEMGKVRLLASAAKEPISLESIVLAVEKAASARWQPHFLPVINATGVILHTNLGRAPLSHASLDAVQQTSATYSNLEYDIDSGERGSRFAHVVSLLKHLTGSEEALAVNNNAAAVLLTMTALAQDKEVIISRSEAVEIGGGFRIPDVMKQSGARLVEVGTTNRTYVRDFEDAITANTAALLRVHSSNFKIIGFTHSVELADMAKLAQRKGVALLDDLGSGSLIDTSKFGLTHEPMVQESVQAGADVTCFSGDKLLGGPQAGIIVGKRPYISRIAKHPIARAVRIDKMTLAALAATLEHYVKDEAVEKIPVWRMIALNPNDIALRAKAWAERLGGIASVIPGESTVGGGSLPGATLETFLLAIDCSGKLNASDVAARLRTQRHPVVARIERERLVFDPRTVLPAQDEELMESILNALESMS